MGARERAGEQRRRTSDRQSAKQPWPRAESRHGFRGTLRRRGRGARATLLASATARLYGLSQERNSWSVNATAQVETTVEGTLDHVLYVNEENGYAVAVVRTIAERGDSRTVTVVGNLAGLEIGSAIRVRGRFEKHPRFGEQFRVEDYETLRPAGAFALERYLAAEIQGVGPSLARR